MVKQLQIKALYLPPPHHATEEMAAKTASDLLKLAVSNIEEFVDSDVLLKQDISLATARLAELGDELLCAVTAVNNVGARELLTLNPQHAVAEHQAALQRCNVIAEQLRTPEHSYSFEMVLAEAVADTDYVSLTESAPLQPVRRQKFSLFVSPLPMASLPLISVPSAAPSRRRRQPRAGRAPPVKRPRIRVPPSRRIVAPTTAFGDRAKDELIAGIQPTEAEVEKFKQRSLQALRGVSMTKRSLPKDTVVANLTLSRGQFIDWLRQRINDPSTIALDTTVAISGTLAYVFGLAGAVIPSALFARLLAFIAVKGDIVRGEDSITAYIQNLSIRQTVAAQSVALVFTGMSGAALGGLSSLSSFAFRLLRTPSSAAASNLLELLYGFISLRQVDTQSLLQERERNSWIRFAYRWSPFLSFAAAAALVAIRQDVVSWLLSSNVTLVQDSLRLVVDVTDSPTLIADTPGTVLLSVASALLPSDGATITMLTDFYKRAKEGIDQLRFPTQAVPVGTFTLGTIARLVEGTFPRLAELIQASSNWLYTYFNFVIGLHKLRFAFSIIHSYSIIEWGTIKLLEGWLALSNRIKDTVADLFPDQRNNIHMYADWMIAISEFFLLSVRSFVQLFRYRSIMLLLLALARSIITHGLLVTNNALEAIPTFYIQ